MRTPCRPPLGERRRTAPNSPWRRWDGACGGSVQAELVALRVGHHDGARRERRGGIVALEPGRAMRTKPFGLRFQGRHPRVALQDRKSTRLNSSHVAISYAVFCLQKKKKNNE